MKRRLAVIMTVAGALALSGCTGSVTPPPETTAPPAAPSTEPTEAAPPEPTSNVIVLSVDGVTPDGGPTMGWDQGPAIMAFFSDRFGAPESTTPLEPDPSGIPATSYAWTEVVLYVPESGRSGLTAVASSEDGVFETPSGISIGDTREQAIAAGAEELDFDPNGDGQADVVVDDRREADGTQSLLTPGTVGSDYVEITIADAVVTRLIAPASDYGDV